MPSYKYAPRASWRNPRAPGRGGPGRRGLETKLIVVIFLVQGRTKIYSRHLAVGGLRGTKTSEIRPVRDPIEAHVFVVDAQTLAMRRRGARDRCTIAGCPAAATLYHARLSRREFVCPSCESRATPGGPLITSTSAPREVAGSSRALWLASLTAMRPELPRGIRPRWLPHAYQANS